jgi:hypothetical protein
MAKKLVQPNDLVGIAGFERISLLDEIRDAMKVIQLDISVNSHIEPILVLGSVTKNHGEILEEILEKIQLPFDIFKLSDSDGYPKSGKAGVYSAIGMGFATMIYFARKKIFLVDRSGTYNIPVSKEHADRFNRLSDVQLEIIV